MFSGLELKAIKEWAEVGKTMLSDQMKSKMFTDKEKIEKLSEYETLELVLETVDDIQAQYVSADADQLVHSLWVIEEHSKWLKEQLDTAEISTEDYAAERYQIGYMQARIELGFLTWDDIHVLEEWEGEMP